MKRTVENVMTKVVVTARDSAPYKELVRLMDEYRVSALPVTDESGRLVGIVSEGDLVLKEDEHLADEPFFEGRRHREKRMKAAGLVAGQLMTAPVTTIGPDATLGAAARMMHERAIKRLPVVDESGCLLGIVSRSDLLRIFLRRDGDIEREVKEDVIHRTMWIDPASIHVSVNEGVVSLHGQLERRSLIPVMESLVGGVDGVVAVETHLSFDVDDVTPAVALPPWGAMAQVSRR